jgi:transposase-like protein
LPTRLGFKRRRKTFGGRNSIEQWFSRLKRRTRQFNTCHTTNNLKRTERWIKTWITLS